MKMGNLELTVEELGELRKFLFYFRTRIGQLCENSSKNEEYNYIPTFGEIVLVSDELDESTFLQRIFTVHNYGKQFPFVCVSQNLDSNNVKNYKSGEDYKTADFKYCKKIDGKVIKFGCNNLKPQGSFVTDSNKAFETFIKLKYLHLLPEGYEFCNESEAEKLVKIKLINLPDEAPIGNVCNSPKNIVERYKTFYRPIRKIQPEPNPYAVDWSQAPEWADSHAFDANNKGFWYGCVMGDLGWDCAADESNFTLIAKGLDWKLSKTVRLK